MAPWISIESFDDTSLGYTWIVNYLTLHHNRRLQQLKEGLYAIECTCAVPAGNYHLRVSDI